MAGFFEDLIDFITRDFKPYPIKRDTFADIERNIREIEMLDLSKIIRAEPLPEIPEGYELVKRGGSARSVPLPKPTIMPEALEYAHYANVKRQELFGRPYVPFMSADLPDIRVLTYEEMRHWVHNDGVLGEYADDTRTLTLLGDADIMALPDVSAWGTDDRLLIRKSVLLHELVHWLQYREVFGDTGPLFKDYASMMNMEIEAWTIQAHWLNEHGQTTSMFARLNDVPATVERMYGQYTRDWLAMRDHDRLLTGRR